MDSEFVQIFGIQKLIRLLDCRIWIKSESTDSQATLSCSYKRLQILWSDNFAEFDQILRLQNLIRFLVCSILRRHELIPHFKLRNDGDIDNSAKKASIYHHIPREIHKCISSMYFLYIICFA